LPQITQNKINLIKKTKQQSDNNTINKVKPSDISKESAIEDDSAYLENSTKNNKLTTTPNSQTLLNKQNTKSKPNVGMNQNQNQIKDKSKKASSKNINKTSDHKSAASALAANKKSEATVITKGTPDASSLSSNRSDRTNLEKKMDSAIDYIANLSEEHVFDYTKSVIRDFLIFIKKVASANNDKKEDLDCHFKVIIKILDNIFDQIEKLAIKLNLDNLHDFIPEEVFIQTFKIIITAPCFLIEIDAVLLPFLDKLRKLISNDAKFFDIYYEILNKFICFEKGSSFLQGVNSKNTFIVFYDFFLFSEPKFRDLDVLRKFEPYISKNIFLSEEEKIRYINEYRLVISAVENQQLQQEIGSGGLVAAANDYYYDDDYKKEGNYLNANGNNINNKRENYKNKEVELNVNNNDYGNFGIVKNKKYNSKSEDLEEKKEDVDDEDDEIEEEEEIIIRNYGKKNNRENQIINDPENHQSININSSNNNNYKNAATTVNRDNERVENKDYERDQTAEKTNEINLPENLNKDISKIKDSIKEKCRKLDMNIKRINNKIESETNLSISYANSNNTEKKITGNNQNTTNIDTTDSIDSSSQNDNQRFNKLNDYRNRMQQTNHIGCGNPNNKGNTSISINNNNNNNNNNLFKPKRNLEELEEIDNHEDNNELDNDNDNKTYQEPMYDIHNLPKLNNFIQNKIKNIPLSNRTTQEAYNNNNNNNNNHLMLINNQSLEPYNERQGLNQNRQINNNLMLNRNMNNINNSQQQSNNTNNIDEIKKLILKIPSIILDDCVSEISHYVSLENSFMKMNYEFKDEFIFFLSSSINNDSLIKTSSFNCFLQLLEFLLTLLIWVKKLLYYF